MAQEQNNRLSVVDGWLLAQGKPPAGDHLHPRVRTRVRFRWVLPLPPAITIYLLSGAPRVDRFTKPTTRYQGSSRRPRWSHQNPKWKFFLLDILIREMVRPGADNEYMMFNNQPRASSNLKCWSCRRGARVRVPFYG